VLLKTSAQYLLLVTSTLVACKEGTGGKAGFEPRTKVAQYPASGHTSRRQPTTAPSANVAVASNAEDSFRFSVTNFHFQAGLSAIVVHSDGTVKELLTRQSSVNRQTFCAKANTDVDQAICEQHKNDRQSELLVYRGYLTQYALQSEDLATLRDLLRDANFETLQPEYKQANLQDGSTGSYTLRTKTKRFRVETYTGDTRVLPPKLVALRTFMFGLMKGHEAERTNAVQLSTQAYRAFQQDEIEMP
jgi:hypothetical protein